MSITSCIDMSKTWQRVVMVVILSLFPEIVEEPGRRKRTTTMRRRRGKTGDCGKAQTRLPLVARCHWNRRTLPQNHQLCPRCCTSVKDSGEKTVGPMVRVAVVVVAKKSDTSSNTSNTNSKIKITLRHRRTHNRSLRPCSSRTTSLLSQATLSRTTKSQPRAASGRTPAWHGRS